MARTVVSVNPGICGFDCKISARPSGTSSVRIDISESDCALIQKLAIQIHDVSLHDLYTPLTNNLIFETVEQAGCHLACPVPVDNYQGCRNSLGAGYTKRCCHMFC